MNRRAKKLLRAGAERIRLQINANTPEGEEKLIADNMRIYQHHLLKKAKQENVKKPLKEATNV